MMIVLAVNAEEMVVTRRISAVSWMVVNILMRVPDQFMYAVMTDSCPVVPLAYVVRICVSCGQRTPLDSATD